MSSGKWRSSITTCKHWHMQLRSPFSTMCTRHLIYLARKKWSSSVTTGKAQITPFYNVHKTGLAQISHVLPRLAKLRPPLSTMCIGQLMPSHSWWSSFSSCHDWQSSDHFFPWCAMCIGPLMFSHDWHSSVSSCYDRQSSDHPFPWCA